MTPVSIPPDPYQVALKELREAKEEIRLLTAYSERLRAELLSCYNVIPGIEKVEKLPDLILSGCVSDTIHAFTTGQIEDKRRLNIKLDSLMQCVDEVSEAATDVQDWNGTRLGDAIQLLQAAKGIPHA